MVPWDNVVFENIKDYIDFALDGLFGIPDEYGNYLTQFIRLYNEYYGGNLPERVETVRRQLEAICAAELEKEGGIFKITIEVIRPLLIAVGVNDIIHKPGFYIEMYSHYRAIVSEPRL